MSSALFLLCLLWCTVSVFARSSGPDADGTIEQGALRVVQERFRHLQSLPAVPVFITSTRHCTGCAALAVNDAVNQLRALDSSIVCAVVVIAEEEKDIAALAQKYSTPFIVADTHQAHYRIGMSLDLPALVVYNAAGDVLLRHMDIQHVKPDYGQVYRTLREAAKEGTVSSGAVVPGTESSSSVAGASPQPTAGFRAGNGLLEQPADRSVSSLISPVVDGVHRRLYAINMLSNCIEQWDMASGQLLSPVLIPDSIKYYFRIHAGDPLWQMMEHQGHDIARLVSLYAVRDTLYALLNLLAGYTMENTADNKGEPSLQAVWHSGQVVMKIYTGAVDVIPLPPRHNITKLLACPDGMVGGICVGTDGGEHIPAGQRQTQFFMIDGNHIIRRDSTPCSAYVWDRLHRGVGWIGSAILASDCALWYCSSERQLLVRVSPGGVMRETELRVFSGNTAMTDTAARYLWQDIVATGDTVVLLVSPGESPHHVFALQLYTAHGVFLHERTLDDTHGNAFRSLQFLGVESDRIIALGRTAARQWKLLYLPLAPEDRSSTPLHSHSDR